ncbi:hypothetical protein KC362_g39 [Hortaea werneckii]|nr:hypothetical protein KC362_g39 [Hortaea werneckii]
MRDCSLPSSLSPSSSSSVRDITHLTIFMTELLLGIVREVTNFRLAFCSGVSGGASFSGLGAGFSSLGFERLAMVSANENVDAGLAVDAVDDVVRFSAGFAPVAWAGAPVLIEVPGFLADCNVEKKFDGLAVTCFVFVAGAAEVVAGFATSPVVVLFLTAVAPFNLGAPGAPFGFGAPNAIFFCAPPSPAVLADRLMPATGSGSAFFCGGDADAVFASVVGFDGGAFAAFSFSLPAVLASPILTYRGSTLTRCVFSSVALLNVIFGLKTVE